LVKLGALINGWLIQSSHVVYIQDTDLVTYNIVVNKQ
jgi:hypothetical protein